MKRLMKNTVSAIASCALALSAVGSLAAFADVTPNPVINPGGSFHRLRRPRRHCAGGPGPGAGYVLPASGAAGEPAVKELTHGLR